MSDDILADLFPVIAIVAMIAIAREIFSGDEFLFPILGWAIILGASLLVSVLAKRYG